MLASCLGVCGVRRTQDQDQVDLPWTYAHVKSLSVNDLYHRAIRAVLQQIALIRT